MSQYVWSGVQRRCFTLTFVESLPCLTPRAYGYPRGAVMVSAWSLCHRKSIAFSSLFHRNVRLVGILCWQELVGERRRSSRAPGSSTCPPIIHLPPRSWVRRTERQRSSRSYADVHGDHSVYIDLIRIISSFYHVFIGIFQTWMNSLEEGIPGKRGSRISIDRS